MVEYDMLSLDIIGHCCTWLDGSTSTRLVLSDLNVALRKPFVI